MSDSEDALDIFQEPNNYYKPEREPSFVTHKLLDGRALSLRLIGHSPLWGHFLWNAGRTIADFLEQHAHELVNGRTVLELGAGAGLPGLVSAIHGASTVVVTDYPDADLIDNIRYNVQHCEHLPDQSRTLVEGYLWGASADGLHALLPEGGKPGFDVLILADLLFNHSEHQKLVASVQHTLKKTANAKALVFFTPYRPWLLQKDLAFFDLARNAGFRVNKILEKTMDRVMFEEDPGDEMLRRTVFGYELRWQELSEK